MARQHIGQASETNSRRPGARGAKADREGLSKVRALAALPKEQRAAALEEQAAAAADYYASIVDDYDDCDELVEY